MKIKKWNENLIIIYFTKKEALKLCQNILEKINEKSNKNTLDNEIWHEKKNNIDYFLNII
jgi:hypothetical protein